MTERGMIFNGEMTRAILDGRKTQTRRIMTVQPESSEFGLRYIAESSLAKEVGMYFWSQSDACGMKVRSKPFACPYGKPGDRIWVREAWQAIYDSVDEFGHVEERTYAPSIPKENDNYWHIVYAEYFGNESREDRGFPWRPAIHMPRWASRILLEITDVRVERLNAISPEDAESEGLECTNFTGFGDEPGLPSYPEPDVYFDPLKKQWKEYPPEAFAGLWESIYGEGSWQANPWVWVIEFKRVEGGAA